MQNEYIKPQEQNPLIKYLPGKTDRNDPGKWLPVWMHLEDTAGIMEKLVLRWLSPNITGFIDSQIEAGDVISISKLIAYLHDIGKFTPVFAGRILENLPYIRQQLDSLYFDFPGSSFFLYESKEAIWNALLDQMIAYYAEHFGSPENLPPVPDSLEELTRLTMHMVNITVHDEKIIMTRKVLTLEQFRDDRVRELATMHFLTGLTDMFTRIFTDMMEKGLLRKDDPGMLAFAYTAPISALIHLCDRDPEKTEDAIRQVEAFSRHFTRIYGE